MVFAWKLVETEQAKTVATNSFQDLTGLIPPDGSRRTLRWDVPPGRWLIGIFSVTPGGICDKGEGPEVDPASREAVLFHLTHMFGRLDAKLRRFYGTTLVDVASDSWEYERHRGEGRYWSPAILDAFPQQAGYDLRERIHALLGYGPERERVLHDLEKVERQLVHDNYFKTVADFLHARGLHHRPQIYGRGLARDLLEAYTLADTPEVEQGDYCLPEAAWAARTTGKPIISCEAFTHLHLKMGVVRRPHGEWESNPAALRGAANAIFGDGVNRIQMHSFSYSPPGLPLPGWRMYAEIHLNRNVPWWPFIRPLNTWLARQQWLLQAGWPVADALVYPVKSNPDDGPFRQMGDQQPISAANTVDCANEQTLGFIPAACVAGSYQINHVILLDALKTPAEAGHILALLDTGARVVCTHSLPEQWPALCSAEAAAVARTLRGRAGRGSPAGPPGRRLEGGDGGGAVGALVAGHNPSRLPASPGSGRQTFTCCSIPAMIFKVRFRSRTRASASSFGTPTADASRPWPGWPTATTGFMSRSRSGTVSRAPSSSAPPIVLFTSRSARRGILLRRPQKAARPVRRHG